MPQSSAVYAVARIRAVEKRLIRTDRMTRILEASLEDALKLLCETGYGSLPDATADDMDRMIERELSNAAALVSAITPDRDLTDLFLMQTDVNNLKILLKARLMNEDPPPLQAGGVFGAQKLAAWVKAGQYRDLPPAFSAALCSLESSLAVRPEPQKISLALDRAYLAHAIDTAKKKSCGFAEAYFSAQADFANVLALLRISAMQAGAEMLSHAFLSGGAISLSTLKSAYGLSADALSSAVATGPCAREIAAGLSEIAKTGHISALEKWRDNALMNIMRSGKYGIDGIDALVGYLVAKEREALMIRLILTAKRNGLPQSVLQERMRELYV